MRPWILAAVMLISPLALLSQSSKYQLPIPQAPQGPVTVSGCLEGADGRYFIVDHEGTSHKLSGNTTQLDRYLNHQLEITGMPASVQKNVGINASTSPANVQDVPIVRVQRIREIAPTCNGIGR